MKKIYALIAGMILAIGMLVAPAFAETDECVPSPETTQTEWFESDPGEPWEATGEDRVKTKGSGDSYTEWANEGAPVQTETNVAPAVTDSNLERYVSAGTVEVSNNDGTEDSDTRVWWVLKGKDWAPNDGTPPVDHPSWKQQPNLPNENSQHAYPGENGLGNPYQPGNNEGNGDWFRFTGEFTPGQNETTHTEYLWQKQVRTFEEGTDDVLEYKYTKTIEAVVCDDEPGEKPEPEKPETPNKPEVPGKPEAPKPPVDKPEIGTPVEAERPVEAPPVETKTEHVYTEDKRVSTTYEKVDKEWVVVERDSAPISAGPTEWEEEGM